MGKYLKADPSLSHEDRMRYYRSALRKQMILGKVLMLSLVVASAVVLVLLLGNWR